MLKKLWEYKKFRFLCAGTTNAVVDLTILNTLVFKFHFPIWLGNTISVGIAATLSYFLNHFVVFRHHTRPNFKQYFKFFLVTGVSVILLQNLIIYLAKGSYLDLVNHLLGLHSYDKQIALNLSKITAALVGLAWNFFFYSRVIFKKNKDNTDEELDIASLV